MNGRMNHPQCVPPPAICLQFPSLQACTEELPLMLQRPDNFPRVMGILQEINQEKLGFSSCIGDAQQHHVVSEVKQEIADVEEQHQSLNSELCQEWSLKGVEELLTEPEDLQLRDDCFRQAHEPIVSDAEACATDEKPLICLRFVQPHYDQDALQAVQPPVDEKPLSRTEMGSSLREQSLFQGNDQPIDEKPKTPEVLLAACIQLDVRSKLCHTVPAPFQVHVEDRLSLHTVQAVKRELEEMETEAHPCSERETPFGKGKGSNDREASNRVDRRIEATLPGSKSQSGRAQPLEPELKLHKEKRRWSTHSIQRNTSAVLVLPADVAEQENSHAGIGYAQLSPSSSMSLASEGTMCPSVPCEKGQILVGGGKPQSVKAEPDCCALTLGLTSKPQVAKRVCLPLDCSEDKPDVKPFIVQGKHDGQCQKTSPHQWQHARKRGVSHKYYSHVGKVIMPGCPQKQLFPAITDGCTSLSDKDAGNPMDCMPNGTDYHKVYVEPENFRPKSEAGQLLSATSDCRASNKSCGDETGSRKTLQLLMQSIDEGGAPLEQGEIQENMSADDSEVTEPNSPVVTESSQPPQAEVASLATEPQKKRMRGTLILDEKGDGISKETDTRCHRSDGKSWRCVRECINGAYYCQYHLRKRRIGYNRRKNNNVNPDDLEAVSKESLKPNKKSR